MNEGVAQAVLEAYHEGLAHGRKAAEEEQKEHRALLAQQVDALTALLGEDMNLEEVVIQDRMTRRITLSIDVADSLYFRKDLKDLVQSIHQQLSDGVAQLLIKKAPGLLRYRPANHGWAAKLSKLDSLG